MLLEFAARLFHARSAGSRPAPLPQKAPAGRRGKILVIECQAELAELLAQVLANHGYQTRWASTGPAGLATAREFEPELVILCTFLPQKMSGFDQCNVLRWGLGLPSLRIIMMSAAPMEGLRERALEAGADDFIAKPFDFIMLLRAVKRLVGQ
ncbi:MAG: response regulator transcription factor [Elusimicrobia bacterium]|nr:response regulator transcription factor [Elusimicrobiota bacterium]